MEILRYSKNITLPDKKRYIALGVFDGVHLGHQKLIKKVVEKAKQNKGISIVATFEPHPDKVITSAQQRIFLLTPQNEKIKLIQNLGVEILLIVNFNKALRKMSPEYFIQKILVNKLKVHELFVGFNFKFGFQGRGNVEYLKEMGNKYNFRTTIIRPVISNHTIISSTKIKEFIQQGDILQAKKFLGYNLMFSGKIIQGKGRGKDLLNVATANVRLPRDKINPANGVYLVITNIKNYKYYGLMNVGTRPTFNEVNRTIEIHILDFNQDIYKQDLSFVIIKKIREEKYFSNVDLLKEQIKKDIAYARKLIAKKAI